MQQIIWANDLNLYTIKNDIKMVNKFMKTCLKSLVIRKCNLKLQCNTIAHPKE